MLGRSGRGGGCHGVKSMMRVLGKHEHFTLPCGFGSGEGSALPLDTACRGPGADPAPTLVLSWSWQTSSMVSSWASGEPGCHTVSRGPGGLLFFLMRLTHTPGSTVPHNYTKCTSLKMLISPLTHFGLRAIVPTSPGSGAQPMTHRPPPFSNEIASQGEVNRALVNLGIALEDPSPLLGPKAPSAPRLYTHRPASVPAPTRCRSPLGVAHGPGLFSLLSAALHQPSWRG